MYIEYDENSVEFEFLVNKMQEHNSSKAVHIEMKNIQQQQQQQLKNKNICI